MDGAYVPEAAIDEDGNPAFREDDVRPDADPVQVETVVLPEAIAPGVESRPQADLGLGVNPPVGLHVARTAGVQGHRPTCVLLAVLDCGHEDSLRVGSRGLGTVTEDGPGLPGTQASATEGEL